MLAATACLTPNFPQRSVRREKGTPKLSENIKTFRKAKGLSQEELAIKLNVVRQTVPKWERSLSVPDSEMLISLGEALDVSVGALLGETAAAPEPNNLETLAGKLEVVNLQIARMQAAKQRMACRLLIALAAALAIVFVALAAVDGSYLDWNLADPESAVAATILHGFEWLYVRIAPLAFIGAVAGVVALRPKA